MKIWRESIVFTIFGVALWVSSCDQEEDNNVSAKDPAETEQSSLPKPPVTWQEHWFEHNQLLRCVYYDDHLALYFDGDVDPSVIWPNTFLTKAWAYVKEVYGDFGDDSRLFAVLHTGKYGGGHPATYFDESHDYRNVIDCGAGPWTDQAGMDMLTHEIAHIVEGASKGTKESPAFGLWGDSKWAEIFIYDVYLALDKKAEAERFFDEMQHKTDDFPRPATYWFRDWFYPVYTQYGKAEVLNNFFRLLAAHFPKNENTYARRMNWGEFIHFWSGAAATDLKPLATEAFGWSDDWEMQLNTAKATFDKIQY